MCLRLADGADIPHCLVTGLGSPFPWPGLSSKLSGVLGRSVIRPTDGPASYATFLLPNFEELRGTAITYADQSLRAARLTLSGGGWRIIVDQSVNLKEVKKELRAAGGFGITHVGRLEREDGKLFTAREVCEILDALTWYLSFCAARWTGPCLAHGFTANGEKVWETWHVSRTSPYRQRASWLDAHHTEHFQDPFPGFMSRWLDDAWKEVIHTAIHWYVEANAQAGSIEGSIVLTQTAFELLASAVLVENCSWLSQDGFDKLSAADRLRLLFLWAAMPTAIPPDLGELTRLAKADNWADSAVAMTMIRNTITHPTRKNREKFGRHPVDARTEAWALGLWYLEMCLLRLFNYRGTYGSRLQQRYMGQVTPVPWA
jgi:hypothetical protein